MSIATDFGRSGAPPRIEPGIRSTRHTGAQPRAAATAGTFDCGVGRLRHRAEVPIDDEPPIWCLRASMRFASRTTLARSCDYVARRDWPSGGCVRPLGGGFRRYSVDEISGSVPHFEKMLYDPGATDTRVPARLSGASASRVGSRWSRRRIDYVLRDLRHPLGGFYSAEDAGFTRRARARARGSVSTPDDRRGHRRARPRMPQLLLMWYEFTAAGNFRGRTIPSAVNHRGPSCCGLPRSKPARQRLFEARREGRPPWGSTTRC